MLQFDQQDAREGFFLLDIASIDVGDRLRPADEAHVLAIAASMSQAGQITPIRVRNGDGNRVTLVAGLHRLRAAEALGWTRIAAERVNVDECAARLVEIDENLCRHELTALDRAIFLAERKRVYEELYPEARHGGDRRRKGTANQVAMLATWSRFTADAAEKTGLSERTIRRACHLAAALTPSIVDHLRASGIADNAAQLRKLVEIDDDSERQLVAEALAAGAASVEGAKAHAGLASPRAEIDPDERSFQQFLTIWHRANARLRQSIRDEIEKYDAAPRAPRRSRGDAA